MKSLTGNITFGTPFAAPLGQPTASRVSLLPINTAAPTITGTARVGQTLTGHRGTWSNHPVQYTYQWYVDAAPVGGQTGLTYVPLVGDLGKVITFGVIAHNIAGATAETQSAATAAVIAIAPVNTAVPTITGTAQVGQTLTVHNGTWLNTPLTHTYQWKANGVAIGGATASTFILTLTQLAAVITVTETATNTGGSGSATSIGTSAVAA